MNVFSNPTPTSVISALLGIRTAALTDQDLMHTTDSTQGGMMNSAVSSRVLRSLSELRRSLRSVSAVFLISVSACAQAPATLTPASTDAKTALQPYLGTWRPTSFAEERKSGWLTISVDRLSLEIGPSVTYDVVEVTDEGVILRVTGREPADDFRGLTALAFSVKTETVTGPTPGAIPRRRELLRICYWFDSLEWLASEMKRAPCGNTYTR